MCRRFRDSSGERQKVRRFVHRVARLWSHGCCAGTDVVGEMTPDRCSERIVACWSLRIRHNSAVAWNQQCPIRVYPTKSRYRCKGKSMPDLEWQPLPSPLWPDPAVWIDV